MGVLNIGDQRRQRLAYAALASQRRSAPQCAAAATLTDISIPRFLDETAVRLLTEAREMFDHLGLRHASIRRHGDELLLFPWVGNRTQLALVRALASQGVTAASEGTAITVPAKDQAQLTDALKTLAAGAAPDAVALARLVPDMMRAKYDAYLGRELLARCYASERIDTARVPAIAAELLAGRPSP